MFAHGVGGLSDPTASVPQRDKEKRGGERSREIATERRAEPKGGRRPYRVCPETEKLSPVAQPPQRDK